MVNMNKSNSRGSIDIWMISTICLGVLSIGAVVFGAWAFMNYNEQKTDVDSKISDAVSIAKKDQADSDEVKFTQREKEPYRTFVGPDDYGQVNLSYPKTWSVYIANDAGNGKSGEYQAYMNPVTVPAIVSTQQYALRINIAQKSYDSAIASYESLVKKGDLKSSSVTIGDATGTRFDGAFSKDIRGSAVLFRIRDKVLTVQTDADTFKPDFETVIATIKFNS